MAGSLQGTGIDVGGVSREVETAIVQTVSSLVALGATPGIVGASLTGLTVIVALAVPPPSPRPRSRSRPAPVKLPLPLKFVLGVELQPGVAPRQR